MNHQATPRVWQCYRRLPEHVQRLADHCYQLLRADSSHPSLHFRKVGRFWSARVGLHCRTLAVEDQGTMVWFWIGSHAEYDRLVGRG